MADAFPSLDLFEEARRAVVAKWRSLGHGSTTDAAEDTAQSAVATYTQRLNHGYAGRFEYPPNIARIAEDAARAVVKKAVRRSKAPTSGYKPRKKKDRLRGDALREAVRVYCETSLKKTTGHEIRELIAALDLARVLPDEQPARAAFEQLWSAIETLVDIGERNRGVTCPDDGAVYAAKNIVHGLGAAIERLRRRPWLIDVETDRKNIIVRLNLWDPLLIHRFFTAHEMALVTLYVLDDAGRFAKPATVREVLRAESKANIQAQKVA